MPIKVKLENKENKIQNLSGLDVRDGFCKFPFIKDDIEYNDKCFKGKRGDWCATQTNPKTKKVVKWAYCDYEEPTPKPTPKESETKTKKKKKFVIKDPKLDLATIPSNLQLPKITHVQPSTFMLPLLIFKLISKIFNNVGR